MNQQDHKKVQEEDIAFIIVYVMMWYGMGLSFWTISDHKHPINPTLPARKNPTPIQPNQYMGCARIEIFIPTQN